MKKSILYFLCFGWIFSIYSQQTIYVTVSTGKIYKLDIQNCTSTLIGTGPVYQDIASCPNGNFYGITGSSIYSVDTNTAASTLLTSGLSFFNNLVCDQNNMLLGVSGTNLYSIDPQTWQVTFLSNIGYSSAGDLTFYQDTLYMAATGGGLVKIDNFNGYTSEYIGNMGPSVYGVSSVTTGFSNCTATQTLISTAGNDIYSVNPFTGASTLLCNNIIPSSFTIYGAASFSESHAINITAGKDSGLFICQGIDTIFIPPFLVNATPNGVWYNTSGQILNNHLYTQGMHAGSQIIKYVIDSLGCKDSSWIDIFVDTLYFNLGTDTSICEGDSILLNVMPQMSPVTYLWNTGSVNNPIWANDTGLYSVQITDGYCFFEDTILIDYVKIPLDLGNDFSLCLDSSYKIQLQVPNATYLWHDSSTDSAYTITQAGTYYVQAQVLQCYKQDTIHVQTNIINFSLGPDRQLCMDDSVLLSANTSQAQYTWDNGLHSSSIYVKDTGFVWVDVKVNQCARRDSIYLYPFNLNLFIGNDTTVCSDEKIIVKATTPNAQYLWQDGSSDSLFSASNAGNYWVKILVNGCSDYDTIHISNFPKDLELEDDIVLCNISDSIILKPSLNYPYYYWSTGSLNPQIMGYPNNTYTLSIIDQYQCVQKDSISVFFHAPSFSLGDDFTFCITDNRYLSAYDGNYISYLWNTGSTEPTILLKESGEYSVTITDVNHCQVSDTLLAKAQFCQLYVPNSFTPNGDELNDIFKPYYEDLFSVTLSIYNRWGDLIFSDNQKNGWDGTYLKEKVQAGVYTYKVEYLIFEDSKKEQKIGQVVLIR